MNKNTLNIYLIFALILMTGIAAFSIFSVGGAVKSVNLSVGARGCETEALEDEAVNGELEMLQLSSASSMIVIEPTTNRILYQQRAHDRRPMASTTKILTAITVLENTPDLQKTVKVPPQCVGIEGSSIYLAANEEITIENLLYGLMLQSGNDCAETLAVITSGSVEKFAELMNETAKKAGARNSNFKNPHGLHHDEHYTTAYDLGLISSYAMKNPTFREISATKQRKMPWQGRDYGRVVNNKNKILTQYEGGNGIKTGFTKKAGRCLVASAQRGDMEVIAVVLNCGPMFEECKTLMTRAFENFKMTEVLEANAVHGSVNVTNSQKSKLKVFSVEKRLYPLREGELDSLSTVVELPESVKAPVEAYQEVGKVKIYSKNQLLFSEKLYTMEEANSLKSGANLGDLVKKWFGKH